MRTRINVCEPRLWRLWRLWSIKQVRALKFQDNWMIARWSEELDYEQFKWWLKIQKTKKNLILKLLQEPSGEHLSEPSQFPHWPNKCLEKYEISEFAISNRSCVLNNNWMRTLKEFERWNLVVRFTIISIF